LALVRENRIAADVIIRRADDTSERRAFYDQIDKRSDQALALAGRKTGRLAAGSYLVAAVLAAGGLAVLALKLPPLRINAPAVA
jgi:hypothetical protein